MRSAWLALASLAVIALGGCELYFEDDPEAPGPGSPGTPGTPGDGDATCPKPGTYAEIFYPLDGATNVPQPVPIKMHVFIPNTLDGKGIYLSDANGTQVDLDYYDSSCSISPPPWQGGRTQDDTWTECYSNLEPDAVYTWHIWLTCYDGSGIHTLATSTFRTAPAP